MKIKQENARGDLVKYVQNDARAVYDLNKTHTQTKTTKFKKVKNRIN